MDIKTKRQKDNRTKEQRQRGLKDKKTTGKNYKLIKRHEDKNTEGQTCRYNSIKGQKDKKDEKIKGQ